MPEPFAPLLRRKVLLGGAEESTSGTNVYSSITAALAATSVVTAEMSPQDIYASGMRKPLGNYLGTYKNVPGLTPARLSFQQEIAPGDRFIPLLTGAGFTSGAPTSNMASRKTWSWKKWHDGRLQRMYGAAADLTIEIEAGKPAVANWEWSGVWSDLDTDAAMPSQPTVTGLPYVATAATLSVASATPPRWQKATIRLGNAVQPLISGMATGGIAYHVITERDIRIELDFEARKKADLDAYGLLTVATEVALSLVLTRGANTLAIAAPKAQRIEIREGERNGVLLDTVVFACNASSGDDELTFTEA